MSATPSPAEAARTDVPDDWERALLERQLERLDRLAEMGMAIAASIERHAAEDAPDGDPGRAAIDFARVSRAVRMTLALQSRLVRDFKTPPKAGQAANDDDDGPILPEIYWASGEPLTRSAEARVLREAVRGVAENRGLQAEAVERLAAEAVERWEGLERDEIYGRLKRPFGEVVATICEELGLTPEAGIAGAELEFPFPLDGGRDGMGVNAPPSPNRPLEATAPPSSHPEPSG